MVPVWPLDCALLVTRVLIGRLEYPYPMALLYVME